VDVTAVNSASGIQDLRSDLLENICKRQLSVDEAENFEERILELRLQQEAYQNSLSEQENSLYAPVQGYFSRYSDGCENRYNSGVLFEMTAADIVSAIEEEYHLTEDVPGKIMTEHNWYCAFVLSQEDGERFRVGKKVQVTFESESLSNIEMEVYEVTEEPETANTIVILTSKEIVPGILSARSVTAKIYFSTYTGLRVSDSAVRLVDGQVGVYVSSGYDIRFRPIEVLYQGDGYQICREDLTIENGLKMFDQVIVKGTDLYDGKPLL